MPLRRSAEECGYGQVGPVVTDERGARMRDRIEYCGVRRYVAAIAKGCGATLGEEDIPGEFVSFGPSFHIDLPDQRQEVGRSHKGYGRIRFQRAAEREIDGDCAIAGVIHQVSGFKRSVVHAGNALELTRSENFRVVGGVQRIHVEQLAIGPHVEPDMGIFGRRPAGVRGGNLEGREFREAVVRRDGRYAEPDELLLSRGAVRLCFGLRQRRARVRNEEDRGSRGLKRYQILRFADEGRQIDIEARNRRDSPLRRRKLVNLSQLLAAMMLQERHLNAFSGQTLAAGKELVYGNKKQAIVVARDLPAERVHHRVLIGELSPFGEKSRIARRHHRNSGSAARWGAPEAATQWIIVHRRCSDAGNSRSRVRHVGVPAMHAGAARTVLTSEHGNDDVAKILKLPFGGAVDVVLDRVQFHQRREVLISPRTGGRWIHVRASQSVIEQTARRIAGFNGRGSGG